MKHQSFPDGSDGKESSCNAGDLSSTPGLGRSPGEGNGYPLQYSCLENSMDRGIWWATVHGLTKSPTKLKRLTPSLSKWKLKSLSLCSPTDYTVHEILQARTLEWVAFPFSRESSQSRDWSQVSHIPGGFFTTWVTGEAQEYWSG